MASLCRSYLNPMLVAFVIVAIVIDQGALSTSITSRKPKNRNGPVAGNENCADHSGLIDKCASQATYSYTSTLNPYPTQLSEMKASCDRISEGLKCLKTQSKCLQGFSRRTIQTFVASRSKHSRRLCANSISGASHAAEFVKLSQCIKDKGKSPVFIDREKVFIGTLQILSNPNKTMKWDDRFHSTCCAAAKYRDQCIKDLGPECKQYSTQQEEMVSSMIGELLEAVCPENNRLDEICPKLEKIVVPEKWKPVSLTSAALDMIGVLSDDEQQ